MSARRRERAKTEELECKAFIQALASCSDPMKIRCWHIPNESMDPVRGAIMKAMGVLPGVPDYDVRWSGGQALLEFKGPRGKLSDAQRELHAVLTDWGHRVHVVRSVETALWTLELLGAPLSRLWREDSRLVLAGARRREAASAAVAQFQKRQKAKRGAS